MGHAVPESFVFALLLNATKKNLLMEEVFDIKDTAVLVLRESVMW